MNSGPTWYDVLGVVESATTAEIKQAWRDATETPGPNFSSLNKAAEILLDAEKRAAYDHSLGIKQAKVPGPKKTTAKKSAKSSAAQPAMTATETADATSLPIQESTPAEALVSTAAGADTKISELDATLGTGVSSSAQKKFGLLDWLSISLALLTSVALALGASYYFKNRTANSLRTAETEAVAAATQAVPVILAYDYRNLTQNLNQSVKYMTAKYRGEYTKTFKKLIIGNKTKSNAAQLKTVVTAKVRNAGVVSGGKDEVRVLVFMNQSTSKVGARCANGSKPPCLVGNRLVLTMKQENNAWLVDAVTSY